MFKDLRTLIFISLILASLLVVPGFVEALDYPERDIHLISHGSAGGGMDIYLRQLGKAMEEELDVSVVVENRVGGASAKATSYVANSDPDGYTILGVTNTHIVTPLANDVEHSLHDLTPLCRMLTEPLVVCTKSDNPWEEPKDLMEDIKENPGGISWGIAQVGSLAYQMVDQIKADGYELMVLPFEGGGDLSAAIAGGHVDIGTLQPSEAASQVASGNVKIIGTFQNERLADYPEVKTFVEQDYPYQGAKIRALHLPKDTPSEIVNYLEDLMEKILNENESFEKFYKDASMTPSFLDSEAYSKDIEALEKGVQGYLERQEN